MNLSRPILKGLSSLGFVIPTPIQARAIPVALMGKDLCGGAVTGSGKTAAFVVPIVERLLYRPRSVPLTRVLILCPTRELAMQCHNVAVKIATFTDITFCLCVGGLSLKNQESSLKERPDFIIATPGRLIDHIRNSASFSLDSIEILVMDEADRMLEDGFADELNEIVKSCPKERQTMLFSATMTDNVDELIRLSLKRPVRLMIDSSKSAAKRLIQEFVRVRSHREDDRAAMLITLCKKFRNKCIIFFRSKAAAHQMKIVFGLMSLNAAELHGNLTQEQRIKALEDFRDGNVDYLLATDLASRGLDIQGVNTVINYNMPNQFAQYLHRVGRTARAGRTGRSISLVGEADRKLLKAAIKSNTDKQNNPVKHRNLPQELVEKYSKKLSKLAPKIEAILKEEKEEKMLSKAEMEITKAENLMKHEAEIKARPARTWFQSSSEKKKASVLGTKEYKKKKV
ncbi:DEAD-domain-containing protein [Neoconidiobolus thromboides FSU 785]|nr:DEAD-domain-containing protein [Neoconidiobolus thromboides FSU 785]